MPKYQEENYTKKEMIKIKNFIFSNLIQIQNKLINLKTSKTKIIILVNFMNHFNFWLIFPYDNNYFFS